MHIRGYKEPRKRNDDKETIEFYQNERDMTDNSSKLIYRWQISTYRYGQHH